MGQVSGTFNSQQAVMICVITRNVGTPEDEMVDLENIDLERFEVKEVGKGIANYTVAEVSRVMGFKSTDFVEKLGYMDSDHVCHR
jgi:glutamate 5-kinase